MKTYRRILVPIPAGGQAEVLLQRAGEIAASSHAGVRMLVVRVLDTRSGFESDGPAGVLPGEQAARRAPEAKKRLDLLLARSNLSWVEAKVTWGKPEAALEEVIRGWSPDLVVACSGLLAQDMASGPDVLRVSCRSRFGRLAHAIHMPAADPA